MLRVLSSGWWKKVNMREHDMVLNRLHHLDILTYSLLSVLLLLLHRLHFLRFLSLPPIHPSPTKYACARS